VAVEEDSCGGLEVAQYGEPGGELVDKTDGGFQEGELGGEVDLENQV
jgi:hypothetical protein